MSKVTPVYGNLFGLAVKVDVWHLEEVGPVLCQYLLKDHLEVKYTTHLVLKTLFNIVEARKNFFLNFDICVV